MATVGRQWTGACAPIAGILALVVLSACSDQERSRFRDTDGGAVADGGVRFDGNLPDGGPGDGGHSGDDGSVPTDAATPVDGGSSVDAGDVDAGADAGTVSRDAASAMIVAVLAASDGALDLPIEGALVTYVKPAVGEDPPGFFLQALAAGPAVFVAVDPGSLSPDPRVGDEVSMRVTEKTTVDEQRRVTAVADFAVSARGLDADVMALVTDASMVTDLTSSLDRYESRLLAITGTVVEAFGGAGPDHVAARFETTSVTAEPNLRVRLTTALQQSADVTPGCEILLTAPLWRYRTVAQVSGWDRDDLVVIDCPAPQVVEAVAVSVTQVRVRFDRAIAPASIDRSGTQFALSGGLLASVGSPSARDSVTVMTTAQTADTTYSVTVDSSLTDTLGTGIDPAHNSADFFGYAVPAVLRVNEVNANISSGCDLVELRVVRGGSMRGITLHERTSTVLEFPAGFNVATNDLIVVHFNGSSSTCNGSTSTDETSSIDEQPASSHAQNYDSAFDFYSADTGITSTNNVITIYDALDQIVDGVLLASDGSSAEAATDSERQAAALAADGQWEMVGGGVPAAGFVDLDFNSHAALDLDGCGASSAGQSIQRLDDGDTQTKADWNAGPVTQTWGALNAGQSAL